MGGYVTEEQRLAALRGYGVLDTPNEPQFDAIVRTAATFFDVPIALISLIDSDRQWFKARIGLQAAETPRSISFCTHAIRGDDALVVPDAAADERFRDNPLVLHDPHIRFYAGAPIRTSSGARLGTVCVIAPEARAAPPEAAVEFLRSLARRTVEAFELRAAMRRHLRSWPPASRATA
jgi:GAF domain-containing protein